ncbi:response regulator [Paenibacillus curdlanolyticus]|uniref:hypothetical protein n=1 Tax=Paenibacillus curdlanolyticus TaxID=59840 RepID=UPI001F414AB2|nr:hypothetical protein [Paenibacillus curdlanolyticus]
MRLLIVDDEVIIRNGLSTVINWKELGFELLSPAASRSGSAVPLPEREAAYRADGHPYDRHGRHIAGIGAEEAEARYGSHYFDGV